MSRCAGEQFETANLYHGIYNDEFEFLTFKYKGSSAFWEFVSWSNQHRVDLVSS